MDWLIETAKQVPALAVLTILVYWFLRHLERQRETSDRTNETLIAASEVIGRALQVIETIEKQK